MLTHTVRPTLRLLSVLLRLFRMGQFDIEMRYDWILCTYITERWKLEFLDIVLHHFR